MANTFSVVYKVVARTVWDASDLRSLTELDGLTVNYKVGEPIRAQVGKLFAFATLEEARVFASTLSLDGRKPTIYMALAGLCSQRLQERIAREGVPGYRVLEDCRAPSRRRRVVASFWRYGSGGRALRRQAGGSVVCLYTVPRGTVACNWVILTKEVE